MTVVMWTRVDYVPEREMWSVEVYRDGVWLLTAWFHTEWAADIYAAEARLGG